MPPQEEFCRGSRKNGRIPQDLRFPAAIILGIIGIAVLSGALTRLGTVMFDGRVSDSNDIMHAMHRLWYGNRPEISVVAASYGLNCRDFPSPPYLPKRVHAGNVTAPLKSACNGRAHCNFMVDVAKIGDPAVGCQKDFSVEYLCVRDDGAESQAQGVKTAILAAEANGKTITLTCRPEK